MSKRSLRVGDFEIKLNLLSLNNSKLIKSDKLIGDTMTAGLQLTAGFIDGFETCSNYKDCLSFCNSKTGFFQSRDNVKLSRDRKTELLRDNPTLFMNLLDQDLQNLSYYCELNGLKPVVRLNTSSDLDIYPFFPLMEKFQNVQFYDYSKNLRNLCRYANLPNNYHLVRSFTGKGLEKFSGNKINEMLEKWPLAVIVPIDPKKPKPKFLVKDGLVFRLTDGDKSDHRFLDRPMSIVLLGFKGTRADYKKSADNHWIVSQKFLADSFAYSWSEVELIAKKQGVNFDA